MPEQAQNALWRIVERLVKLSAVDDELRSDLRSVAEVVLQLTSLPEPQPVAAETPTSAAGEALVASPETAQQVIPPAPVVLPALTLGQRSPIQVPQVQWPQVASAGT
jgi:uncharacterized membrane protein